MIKQCKILLDNPAVTVVDFDGRKIQLPHTESQYIKYENGKYTASTKEEYEAELAANAMPKKVRATTKKKKTTTNSTDGAENTANAENTDAAEQTANGE